MFYYFNIPQYEFTIIEYPYTRIIFIIFQQVQVMESSKARLDLEATKLERDLDERIERNAKANGDMCASTPIFYIFVYDSDDSKLYETVSILYVRSAFWIVLNLSNMQRISSGADSSSPRGVRESSKHYEEQDFWRVHLIDSSVCQ